VTCTPLDQCHDAGVCDPDHRPVFRSTEQRRNFMRRRQRLHEDRYLRGWSVVALIHHLHATRRVPRRRRVQPGHRPVLEPQSADGTPCDDGNACTRTDTCIAGLCIGGDPLICTPLDACHDAAPATSYRPVLEPRTARPDPVSFQAEADTYTDRDLPTTNFGTLTSLMLDGRPDRRVYLRFNVSGITPCR